jgi:hypothetical protein
LEVRKFCSFELILICEHAFRENAVYTALQVKVARRPAQ